MLNSIGSSRRHSKFKSVKIVRASAPIAESAAGPKVKNRPRSASGVFRPTESIPR